ncbi:MAG: hypothetical protein WBN07_07015, partial [Woeseiaceae bacterium]
KTVTINSYLIDVSKADAVGIGEAPVDGTPYSRQDAGWVSASGGSVTETDPIFGASPAAGLTGQATQGQMEAGTETDLLTISPLRVAQAIAALGGGGTSGPSIGFHSRAAYSYVDSNSITISAGFAEADGAQLTWPETTQNFVSGTAPLNATGFVYIYVYDNSGAAFAYSTTAPTYDATLGYWKSGTLTSPTDNAGSSVTPGTDARFIGWLLKWQETTGSTYRVLPFYTTVAGNVLELTYGSDHFDSSNVWRANEYASVNSGSATTWTQFSFVSASEAIAIIPSAMTTHYWAAAKIIFDSDQDDAILGISPVNQNSNLLAGHANFTVRAQGGGATTRTFFGRAWLPYVGTNPYYSIQNLTGTNTASIEIWGARVNL